jgi:hypothetical protein
MKTPAQTLAAALRILANDIESPDGVANAAISEAAERLEELTAQVEYVKSHLNELIEVAQRCDCWESFPQKALYRAASAIESSPTQCLREIQAEAAAEAVNECLRIVEQTKTSFNQLSRYHRGVDITPSKFKENAIVELKRYAERVKRGAL